jgi:hypothetical protein
VLRVLLGERAATRPAQEAALAPHQIGPAPGQRQVTHRTRGAPSPPPRPARSGGTARRAVASLDNAPDHEPSGPTRGVRSSCIRCSSWRRDLSPRRASRSPAKVLPPGPLTPADQQDPTFQPAQVSSLHPACGSIVSFIRSPAWQGCTHVVLWRFGIGTSAAHVAKPSHVITEPDRAVAGSLPVRRVGLCGRFLTGRMPSEAFCSPLSTMASWRGCP